MLPSPINVIQGDLESILNLPAIPAINAAADAIDEIVSQIPTVVSSLSGTIVDIINVTSSGTVEVIHAITKIVDIIDSPILTAIHLIEDVTTLNPAVSLIKDGICKIYCLPIVPHISVLDICVTAEFTYVVSFRRNET